MKLYNGGVRHDYKDESVGPARTASRRWLLFAVGLLIPLLATSLYFAADSNQPIAPAPHEPTLAPIPTAALTPPATPESVVEPLLALLPEAPAPIATTLSLLVSPGDTLETLFRKNKLSLADLAAIIDLPSVGSALKLLKPGDRVEVAHHEGQVVTLRRDLDDVKMLSVARTDGGFAASTIEREIDIRTTGAHGVIQTSLFEAGMAARMTDKVTMDMAGIFQWDIDFVQDVRDGDEFTVIYEELWRDGVKLRNGEIVAAEFVNQGKTYRAARFRDGSGHVDYYAPDGRSMRKAFIRAPVDFTRISSGFNPNRRHPVLNTIRAHRGVDYAAPSGTPIWAAGDGKVIFRGVQGGYGNVIVLQHGGNVTTLYGHMSRFANARVGTRVKQGQVIGYVGMSGLATGPHLHYEYRVDGVHRNPRTVSLPAAEPVPAAYQEDFRTAADRLWQQLDLYHVGGPTTAAN